MLYYRKQICLVHVNLIKVDLQLVLQPQRQGSATRKIFDYYRANKKNVKIFSCLILYLIIDIFSFQFLNYLLFHTSHHIGFLQHLQLIHRRHAIRATLYLCKCTVLNAKFRIKISFILNRSKVIIEFTRNAISKQ